ncbi:P63C domain-containing protein [Stenoxybacter acetivorans]|uniref:P63C domain-containing protein n=1 Tax=Stenoxybacter acetivorans TaxID=422441 RepID=UPI000AF8BC66|nr:P63C domain-containing protein [Stenoxybacter acetivorans]
MRPNYPPFLAAKNLEPYITQELIALTKLIEYKDGNAKKSGYDATLLPEMCKIYLTARRKGDLKSSQEKLAMQSELLLSALAKVGIAALIDEATGFQINRKHDALRLLLAKYIEESLQKWIRIFPDSFFAELDRLYGNKPTTSTARPQYYGKFINRYIYEPIEHGYVKKELDTLNIKEDGKRVPDFINGYRKMAEIS